MTIGRSLMIFDVEGTLVESTGLTLRSWQETLQSFGFEFPLTILQRHSGQDPHDMLHELLPGPHVIRVLGRIIEMQGQRYREKYLPQVTTFPDVRTLFERVKRARRLIAPGHELVRRRVRSLPFVAERGRSRRCRGLRRRCSTRQAGFCPHRGRASPCGKGGAGGSSHDRRHPVRRDRGEARPRQSYRNAIGRFFES
jgi:hypothetical protein